MSTVVRPADRSAGVIAEFDILSGEICHAVVQVNIDTRQYVGRWDVSTEPGDAPLQVQRAIKATWSTDPLVLELASTPAAGNLMTLCLWTPGTVTTNMTALGWNRIVGATSSGAMYSKIAGASEPDTLTIVNSASANYANGCLVEWERMAASPVDVSASAAAAGSVTSKTSGTTAVTSQENELAIAMVYYSGSTTSGESWTNGFVDFSSTRNLLVATKLLSTEAAVETTASWTGARTAAGHIVTFKANEPGASVASPRQYSSKFVVLEVEAEEELPPVPIPPDPGGGGGGGGGGAAAGTRFKRGHSPSMLGGRLRAWKDRRFPR